MTHNMSEWAAWMQTHAPQQKFTKNTQYICFMVQYCICVPKKEFNALYGAQLEELRQASTLTNREGIPVHRTQLVSVPVPGDLPCWTPVNPAIDGFATILNDYAGLSHASPANYGYPCFPHERVPVSKAQEYIEKARAWVTKSVANRFTVESFQKDAKRQGADIVEVFEFEYVRQST